MAEQLSKMPLRDPISPATRQNQNLLTDTYIQIYHITFITGFLENYMQTAFSTLPFASMAEKTEINYNLYRNKMNGVIVEYIFSIPEELDL